MNILTMGASSLAILLLFGFLVAAGVLIVFKRMLKQVLVWGLLFLLIFVMAAGGLYVLSCFLPIARAYILLGAAVLSMLALPVIIFLLKRNF